MKQGTPLQIGEYGATESTLAMTTLFASSYDSLTVFGMHLQPRVGIRMAAKIDSRMKEWGILLLFSTGMQFCGLTSHNKT